MRLLGILSIAAVLRLIGLGYGLPFLYHQDEPIIVNHALALGLTSGNPHFFVLPPLTMYIVFFLSGLVFVVQHLLGQVGGANDFAIQFLKDPSIVYFAGRIALGFIPGLVTVYYVYRKVRLHWDESTACLAASFLAINYLHVQHSHYIYSDIMVTLAATILLFTLIELVQKPSWDTYIWLAVHLGWGVATKYTMLYFVPLILIAHVMAWRFKSVGLKPIGLLMLSGLVSIFTFACLAPYTFIEWSRFISEIQHQAGAEKAMGILHHAKYSLWHGLNPILCVAALVGFVVMAKTMPKRFGVLFALFFALYYGVNAAFSQPFARYMLPLIPMLCVLAAVAWIRLIHSVFKAAWYRKLLLLSIMGVLATPSVYSGYLMLQPDTRTQAFEWFEQHVSAGSVVVRNNPSYGPRLAQVDSQINDKIQLLESRGEGGARKKRQKLLIQANENKKTYQLYTLADSNEAEATNFMALRPFVNKTQKALKEVHAKYILFDYEDHPEAIDELKERLKPHLAKRIVFSPYYDESKILSVDPHDATAAPHQLNELFSRKSLGPYFEIFEYRE